VKEKLDNADKVLFQDLNDFKQIIVTNIQTIVIPNLEKLQVQSTENSQQKWGGFLDSQKLTGSQSQMS